MPLPRKPLLPRVEEHVQQRMVEQDGKTNRALREIPLLEGRQFNTHTVPTAGTIRIGHNLKRVPHGYLVTNSTTPGPGTVYLAAWDAHSITLGNSGAADVTLDFWLF